MMALETARDLGLTEKDLAQWDTEHGHGTSHIRHFQQAAGHRTVMCPVSPHQHRHGRMAAMVILLAFPNRGYPSLFWIKTGWPVPVLSGMFISMTRFRRSLWATGHPIRRTLEKTSAEMQLNRMNESTHSDQADMVTHREMGLLNRFLVLVKVK